MMSLALIPIQFVGALFADIEQDLNDDERGELANLFKYFNDYWMRQISQWNVYEVPDRTNNYNEGISTAISLRFYA